MRWCFVSIAAVLLFSVGCKSPSSQRGPHITQTRPANTADGLPQAPGQFDFYLLTLSWSPEYCHGHPNNPECDGSHPGFVVHGLWPQDTDGRWPSHCSAAPDLADPASMLDIMPDPRLISHEWATHGTCTGLSASAYFHTVRAAYQKIRIPSALQHPTHLRRSSTDEIKRMFVEANPGLSPENIVITCHNRYLSAVAFCMNKALQTVACEDVRDCTARTLLIPAERQ